jgi:hypothetical protein
MSTLLETAAIVEALDIESVSFTDQGCLVVRTPVDGGEHIELSTLGRQAKPLSLAPDFVRDRGRVWPVRS